MTSLSVIINVFNRPDFLAKALLCLAHQSLRPDEVIITDDGSATDMLGVIHSRLSILNMSVKYVRQEHQGFRLSRVRNNAARIAEGDYFVFLDQDIIYTKHFLHTFAENIRPRRFLVAYPVRLTEEQTAGLTEEMIAVGEYPMVTSAQRHKVVRQYRKEKLQHLFKKMHLCRIGPKLRGGLVLINREDFVRVNGFDENYEGWGNEDDDLGHRLHKAGVIGYNPFCREFPLHLYHPPYREGEKRVNLPYYRQRLKEIHEQGLYRCRLGFDHFTENEPVEFIRLQ